MITIEFKNVSPRLTVAKDRAVIKVQSGTEPEQIARLTHAGSQIINQIREIMPATARGRFKFSETGINIQMRIGEGDKHLKSFRFDVEGNLLTPESVVTK